jgi:hypothetical protein
LSKVGNAAEPEAHLFSTIARIEETAAETAAEMQAPSILG